jgi:uncharacterized protein YdeI (BOF family)
MPSTHRIIACLFALSVTVSSPAWAEEVSSTHEGEWISLTGTVEAVLANSFVLDYGDGDVTVDLDRFNWAVDKSLLQDKQVTVTGRMDRNFYDDRSIEAGLVYVPSLNEYIYADPQDEDSDPSLRTNFALGLFAGAKEGDWLSFSGRVTGIEGDEILIDNGISTLRVDTSPIPDGLVPPSVEVGDRVLVTGEMDAADLFDKREVEANAITKLTDLSY